MRLVFLALLALLGGCSDLLIAGRKPPPPPERDRAPGSPKRPVPPEKEPPKQAAR